MRNFGNNTALIAAVLSCALAISGCASSRSAKISPNETKPTSWQAGKCTTDGSNYQCLIYVWGLDDDGLSALLQFIEETIDGKFSVKLRQLFMPKMLKTDGNLAYSLQVDEQPNITLERAQITTSELARKNGTVIALDIPVTSEILRLLESGGKKITTYHVKPDGAIGYSTFRMDGYIKSLVLMNGMASRYRESQ